MRTIPLHGKKAAGRVVRVDDGDFELVSQYRWFVYEPKPKPGRRQLGPYATANKYVGGGRSITIRMHKLITGYPMTDHIDHDGLNNQRHNLRPATNSQNQANKRPRLKRSSLYKGLCWLPRKRKWLVTVTLEGRSRRVGEFISEAEAAYAYDAAARDLFGEYACTNFSAGPVQTMSDQWRAANAAHAVQAAANGARLRGRQVAAWWEQKEPEDRICEQCGAGYRSKSTNSLYCGTKCRKNANRPAENERKRRRRAREREQRRVTAEGRLF